MSLYVDSDGGVPGACMMVALQKGCNEDLNGG
jgi:hypothetical protein